MYIVLYTSIWTASALKHRFLSLLCSFYTDHTDENGDENRGIPYEAGISTADRTLFHFSQSKHDETWQSRGPVKKQTNKVIAL